MPTITINASGFVLDGPLVAGEPAAVSVSGLSLAEDAALSLTCTARFPDALLASVALTQGDGGAWGGVLDTATKQAAFYFLTARADEARAVMLELVDTANRDSLARVSAPMLNSSLLPKPDKAEGASPLMIPGPPGPTGPQGPQGPQGEPGTSIPIPVSIANGGTGANTAAVARANIGAMASTADGNTILTGGEQWGGAPIGVFADVITASVGAKAKLDTLAARYSESGSYEAGDVVWYTDNIYVCTASTPSPAGAFNPSFWIVVNVASLLSEKQDAISDLATIRAGAAAGATAVQPSAMPTSETWTFVVDDGQGGTTTVTKQVAVYAAQTQGAGA